MYYYYLLSTFLCVWEMLAKNKKNMHGDNNNANENHSSREKQQKVLTSSLFEEGSKNKKRRVLFRYNVYSLYLHDRDCVVDDRILHCTRHITITIYNELIFFAKHMACLLFHVFFMFKICFLLPLTHNSPFVVVFVVFRELINSAIIRNGKFFTIIISFKIGSVKNQNRPHLCFMCMWPTLWRKNKVLFLFIYLFYFSAEILFVCYT